MSALLHPVPRLHFLLFHVVATRRHQRRVWLVLALLLAALPKGHAVSAVGPVVVSHGDAFIAHDLASDHWSIGSRDLDVAIGFDAAGAFTLQAITNPVTGRTWNVTPAADVS